MKAYIHKTIVREGIRDQLMLNPKIFEDDSEILHDLKLLLPTWRDLTQQHPKEPLSLKANIRHQRESVPGGGDDERYQLMFDVENDGDLEATDFRLDVEFPGWFLDGSGYTLQRGEAKPGYMMFQISNKTCFPPVEHLYPKTKTATILSFYGGIHAFEKRERPEQLRETITATVFSGNMKPRATSKSIAELSGLET